MTTDMWGVLIPGFLIGFMIGSLVGMTIMGKVAQEWRRLFWEQVRDR